MPRLYVANPTRQQQDLHYRTQYRDGQRTNFPMYKRQAVPAGGQIALGGDMDMVNVDDVVQQLSKYGMVAMTDIKGGRLPDERIRLVFDVDKQVPRPVIAELVNHNDGIAREVGAERRRLAAVGANNALMEALSEEMPTPAELVVDIEQDEQTERGEKVIEEGIRVSNVDTAETRAAKAKAPTKRRINKR